MLPPSSSPSVTLKGRPVVMPEVGMGTASVSGSGGAGQFSLVELGKRLLSSARDGDEEDVR